MILFRVHHADASTYAPPNHVIVDSRWSREYLVGTYLFIIGWLVTIVYSSAKIYFRCVKMSIVKPWINLVPPISLQSEWAYGQYDIEINFCGPWLAFMCLHWLDILKKATLHSWLKFRESRILSSDYQNETWLSQARLWWLSQFKILWTIVSSNQLYE